MTMMLRYVLPTLLLLQRCRASADTVSDQCSWQEPCTDALASIQKRLDVLETLVQVGAATRSDGSSPSSSPPPPPFLFQRRPQLSDHLQLRASWVAHDNITSVAFASRRGWPPHLALVGAANGGVSMLHIGPHWTLQTLPSRCSGPVRAMTAARCHLLHCMLAVHCDSHVHVFNVSTTRSGRAEGSQYDVESLASLSLGLEPPSGRVILQVAHTAREAYVTLVIPPSPPLPSPLRAHDAVPAHDVQSNGALPGDQVAGLTTVLTYLVNGTLVANHTMPGEVLHAQPRGAGMQGFSTNGSFVYHPLTTPSHTALRQTWTVSTTARALTTGPMVVMACPLIGCWQRLQTLSPNHVPLPLTDMGSSLPLHFVAPPCLSQSSPSQVLSAQPLPPPLKPDPSLKPTLLVLPGGLLLLVTNGQAVVFNTSTPAAPALLKRALPSSKPTLVMVTDGGLDLYDQAPAVAAAMTTHTMQHAVVAGRFLLMAHGPLASLLEATGGDAASATAPPTWLGKPAFFLAIAGVVLWNVYGSSKRRDGPNADQLLQRLAAARKGQRGMGEAEGMASFVGRGRRLDNLMDFD